MNSYASLETPLGSRLTDELTTLAICWRIVRRDGVALGFTTHDRPLTIAGLMHDSAPGMAPSAVVRSDGAEVDTMDVAGALTASAITATDLSAGCYDGAAVRLFMVDWQAPDAGALTLAEGVIGAVAIGSGADAGFSATLRGATAALAATVVESYSPECRADLGDRRCRIALRGRQRRGRVLTAAGERLRIAGLAAAAGDYADGLVRVLTGPLAGSDRRILAADGDTLILDEALAVVEGSLVELTEGCDKRFATCAGRFANALNFRGEPHVPGGDVLTRFGGF